MTERHVNPEDPDLYALGALDGEEKQAFEAHVRACEGCAQELVAALQRATLLGLAAEPVAPAPSVKESLLRRAREERPPRMQPVEAVQQVRSFVPRPRRLAWLTPALAVATLVFAVLSGWLWTRNESALQQIATLESQLTVAQAQSLEIARASEETNEILGAPGTIQVALAQQPGGPAGRAAVVYNARLGMAMFTGQLGAVASDKSYQMWIVPTSGAPVSLGVMSSMDLGRMLTAHVRPGMEAKAFAVTVEPKGGMPQPTGPKVLVGVPG
ncbi:MAG TPA: anti-sigma factor [Acidobacteriaceae bacterium]|jgi:anti-sigma-K factor RskA|nr:anti-sigma factor [Acidobacteriaceae bacterium]